MKHIMKSKSKKKFFVRIMLVLGIGLLPSMLGYFLVINPQRESLKIIRDQIKKEDAKLNTTLSAADEDRQNKLKLKLQKLQDQISKFVINPEQVNQLALNVGRTAHKAGLNMFASQGRNERLFNDIPNYEIIGENCVDITFQGSFPQFAAFLNTMERNRPVVYVDKFVITLTNKGPFRNKVNMTLSVLVRKASENVLQDVSVEKVSLEHKRDGDNKVL